MLDPLEEAKRWLSWAEEMRSIAAVKDSTEARRRLEEFAGRLERMAVQAALVSWPPSHRPLSDGHDFPAAKNSHRDGH